MRGAVRNKERWKRRRVPTQGPSTNHLLSRTGGGALARLRGGRGPLPGVQAHGGRVPRLVRMRMSGVPA